MRAFIAGESVSYAKYMLANSVSPPLGGHCLMWRIEPIGGIGSQVRSECQFSPGTFLEV